MSTLSRLCFAPAAFVFAALALMPAAQAGVVFSPQSIVVSQDGTYITDTVNNRDWYKFSNAQSTVGLSLDAVTALFAGSGWKLRPHDGDGELPGLHHQLPRAAH